MAAIARLIRFGLLGLTLSALPSHAFAVDILVSGAGGMHVAGTPGSSGGDVSTLIPSLARPAGSAILPFTVGNSVTASGANSDSSSDSRGLDEKWGDPLNTKLFDSDTVHAGLNYYYGSGLGGSQGGVGFSLHIDN